MGTRIQFFNASTALSQTDAEAIVKALAIQITHDFAPIWGRTANLYLAPVSQKTPTAGYWTIAFLDNADQAGALGYHDVTPEGLPLGKIFVKTTLADGGLVSVTASHECLEMLADPDINLTAEFDDASGNPSKFWALEVCDACEDDSLGYEIKTNGVTVSDFVTPAYFTNLPGPYSFRNQIAAPFQILSGGYMGVLDLANLGQGWQQITADVSGKTLRKSRAPVGSRRERRTIPRSSWTASTYKLVS